MLIADPEAYSDTYFFTGIYFLTVFMLGISSGVGYRAVPCTTATHTRVIAQYGMVACVIVQLENAMCEYASTRRYATVCAFFAACVFAGISIPMCTQVYCTVSDALP